MKNFLLGSLAIIMFISCNEKETPSIEQSINFIIDKVDNRDIYLRDGVYRNVSLTIISNSVVYEYEYYSKENNDHYKITEIFSLNDISYTSQDIHTINVYLKNKKSNYRISKSLNYKSIQDYGSPPNEWLGSAYINVNQHDVKAVQKAFINILKKQRENRGEDYFQSK